MRSTRHSTQTNSEIQGYVARYLQEFVHIEGHGRKCTSSVLIAMLVFAAAWRTSISNACKRLRGMPSDETARQALLATLPEAKTLEADFNRAFDDQVPKSLRKKAQRLAVDLTQIPYHGEPDQDKEEVRPGKAKRGTSRFHTYATIYVVQRGERFTLALTYVSRNDSLTDVLERLLAQVRKTGIRIQFLLLDREFYNVDVVCYLKRVHCPFLMPVARRGRRPKDPAQATSVWRFFVWKKSGWSNQVMQHKGRRTEVNICVSCGNYRGQWGRHGRRCFVFAYWGFRPASPEWVRDTYRKRFGIETSYRQMNEARIRTSTPKPVLRLLYVAIALLLRNAWVWFHLAYLAKRRGCGYQMHLDQLRFRALLLHLFCWATEIAGPVDAAEFQPPQLE